MVWNQMKRYVADKDSRNEEQLIDGVMEFWETVMTVELCNRYIDHIYKVVPVVARIAGAASGDIPNKLFHEPSRSKSISHFEEKIQTPATAALLHNNCRMNYWTVATNGELTLVNTGYGYCQHKHRLPIHTLAAGFDLTAGLAAGFFLAAGLAGSAAGSAADFPTRTVSFRFFVTGVGSEFDVNEESLIIKVNIYFKKERVGTYITYRLGYLDFIDRDSCQ
jgi:hypothetical protein